MNRTIKFRSWDGKKMWNEFGLYGHKLNAGLVAVADQGDILMQFTGLLDKNGVEIYEGDILTFGADNLPVVYEAGAFRMGDTGLSGLILSDHIVIGNIYENPELVEKTI